VFIFHVSFGMNAAQVAVEEVTGQPVGGLGT
jgi:hypothetical protein